MQKGKELSCRWDQAALFRKTDDGGCTRNPEPVFLGDRPACALVDQ
jgi:hypothetical protein